MWAVVALGVCAPAAAQPVFNQQRRDQIRAERDAIDANSVAPATSSINGYTPHRWGASGAGTAPPAPDRGALAAAFYADVCPKLFAALHARDERTQARLLRLTRPDPSASTDLYLACKRRGFNGAAYVEQARQQKRDEDFERKKAHCNEWHSMACGQAVAMAQALCAQGNQGACAL